MDKKEQIKQLMAKPGVKATTIEVTPEIKQRCRAVAHEITEIMMTKLKGPIEALMVMEVIKESIASDMGVKIEGTFSMTNKDMGKEDA